jgi:hypothetical protein
VGASGGGALIQRTAAKRGVLLRNSLAIQCVLFAAALVLAVSAVAAGSASGTRSAGTLPVADQVVILACAALALGLQNAVVRQLAVPDMTTTVLTMTLTGIGSDLRKGDRRTAFGEHSPSSRCSWGLFSGLFSCSHSEALPVSRWRWHFCSSQPEEPPALHAVPPPGRRPRSVFSEVLDVSAVRGGAGARIASAGERGIEWVRDRDAVDYGVPAGIASLTVAAEARRHARPVSHDLAQRRTGRTAGVPI